MIHTAKQGQYFSFQGMLKQAMQEKLHKSEIILTTEEKKRLVAYFNVLIEMDLESKKLKPKE